MNVYYRLSNNEDPEERLEDAALWKAMHDEYQGSITLLSQDDSVPDDGVMFGRIKRGEWYTASGNKQVDYWADPAFLSAASREFYLCDFNDAIARIKEMHSRGIGAFVKATQGKYYTEKVPVGTDPMERIGDMVYSFLDRGKCLMVQELCEFKFEQRFIFINRQLVTSSPIAWHLTPLDCGEFTDGELWETPQSAIPVIAPQNDLTSFAKSVAKECRFPNINIDCALINGAPGVVEFNDCHLGQLGLYACDVRKIAKASRNMIPKRQAA